MEGIPQHQAERPVVACASALDRRHNNSRVASRTAWGAFVAALGVAAVVVAAVSVAGVAAVEIAAGVELVQKIMSPHPSPLVAKESASRLPTESWEIAWHSFVAQMQHLRAVFAVALVVDPVAAVEEGEAVAVDQVLVAVPFQDNA